MRVTGLALAAMLLAASAHAETTAADRAPPEIPLRAWSADGSGHIRMELPEAIPYQARIEADRLIVRFDRPVRADLVAIMAGLPDLIGWAEAAPDGRTFALRLRRPASLRETAAGGVLLLRLTPTAPAPTAATTADAGPARTQVPHVGVRTGVHRGYTRLVFDWPAPVEYKATASTDELLIVFGGPARLDLSQAGSPAAALRTVPQPGGNAAVAIRVPPGGEARHFRLGNRIVVDLHRRTAPAAVAARPQPAPAPVTAPRPAPPLPIARPEPEPATPAPVQTGERPVVERPIVEPPAAEPPATAPAAQPRPTLELPVIPPAAPPLSPPTAAVPASPPQQRAETPGKPPRRESPPPAPSAPSPAPSPMPPPTAAPVVPPELPPVTRPEPVRPATRPDDGPEVQVARGESRLTIGFPGTAGARAAAFRRAGNVWVVFDAPVRLDLAPIATMAADMVAAAEQLPRRDAAVFRLQLSPGFEPTIGRDGAGWILDLQPQGARPERSLEVRTVTGTAGPRVLVEVETPGPVVELTDPDAGDRLFVVPLRPVLLGLAAARQYPEFALLPAPQGLAVAARTERLQVGLIPEGVEITTARGLLIRSDAVAPPAPAPVRQAETGTPLFAMHAWMRAGQPFVETRNALQRAAAEAPDTDRNPARLELAQFLFSRGMAAETLGVLRLVEDEAPAMTSRPQFLAMRGAARLLAAQQEEARADLEDPVLAGEPEAALWRGLELARARRWTAAAPLLRAGQHFVETYPDWLRADFALAGAEAGLEIGDPRMADGWLSLLGPGDLDEPLRSRVAYLRGRLLVADGSLAAGRQTLERAAAGRDRLTRARAGLALVDLGLADGSLAPRDAIEELERLRFAWRGDALEYEVLARLGKAYLDAGEYWEGLTVMRDALTVFPEGDRSALLTERMTAAFRALFTEGKASDLSPLRAMALHAEFRELTPAGADGDGILRHLAGRLVALDLFEPAAAILDDLVRNRLSGSPRARSIADLALVHLLDDKPDAALKALDLAGPDEAGATTRRRHLRARALAALGRTAEALRLLAGDRSRDGETLTADLQWRTADWSGATATYQRIVAGIDDAGPLSEEDARMVLRLAVAQTLAGDLDAARSLGGRYGRTMAATGQAAAFALVTTGSQGELGIDRIAATLAGVDDLRAQLKTYREGLEKPAPADGSS